MSIDQKMQKYGMKAIMECQTNNITNLKMQSNKKQDTIKCKHKRIYSEIRATALRPRLHHYEGFHYPLKELSQRNLTPKGL